MTLKTLLPTSNLTRQELNVSKRACPILFCSCYCLKAHGYLLITLKTLLLASNINRHKVAGPGIMGLLVQQLYGDSGGCTHLSSAWSGLVCHKSWPPLALGPTGLGWWLPFRGWLAWCEQHSLFYLIWRSRVQTPWPAFFFIVKIWP